MKISSLMDCSGAILSGPLNVAQADYRSVVSAESIFKRHGRLQLQGRPGFVTDFVGSITNIDFINGLSRLNGCVEGTPSPLNFHADECEWAAALRAVDLAQGPSFVAVEIGAGWAPWLVSCSLAARRLPNISSISCCGVEADITHHRFMQEHLNANGFLAFEYEAIHAAVCASNGFAVFPQISDPSFDWGARPTFVETLKEAEALVSGPIQDYRGMAFNSGMIVPSIGINSILDRHAKIDLLHVDIQGDEFEVIRSADDELLKRVSFLVIGTHARTIEGRLIEYLSCRGWTLEFEQPCVFDLATRELHVRIDGCQGWRRNDV